MTMMMASILEGSAATVSLEMADEAEDGSEVTLPHVWNSRCGRRNVISGLALIYLVTPKGKGLEECLRAGQRLWTGPPQYLDTIADGIKLRHCGFITTQILIDLAEKEVFDMDDDDMIAAMKFSFEKMKLVIEPAAGATVAAAFSDKFQKLDSSLENIGVVLCGGNLDIEQLPW